MKSIVFKKLANHWYPEIPHDSLDDIRLSRKIEKCFNILDSDNFGFITLMLCEENCLMDEKSLQFSDESMRRYFTTNDDFDLDIWVGNKKFQISSSLYFLLEQLYNFNFHDTGYRIHVM